MTRDPDLHHATAAATRALRDRLLAADVLVPGGDQQAWAEGFAAVLAGIAIGAAWRDFKATVSAWRRPTAGVLLDPQDVTIITDGDGRVVGYCYYPEGGS
jgi:hypothetical protein